MTPRSAVLACLLFAAAGPGASRATSPSPQAIEAKVALEGSVEKRLEAVLRRLLGSDNVIAIVNVDLVHETQAQSDDDLLPGVPTKDSPGSPAALELSSNLVRRITATVYLDKAASDSDAQLVQATASRMLGLNAKRGDTLSVQKIAFQSPPAAGAPARLPQGVLTGLWLLLACALLWVLHRFTGPLPALLRDAVESLKARGAVREAQEEAAKAEPAAAAAAAASGAAAAGVREVPFSFVEERDLPTLKLILRGQQPMTAAVVMHFLPPAMAAELLGALPPASREEIVALMRRPAVLDSDEVSEIEESLRTQLDYLMGGEEQLLKLLDSAQPALQGSVLSDLRRLDPALAQRLSQRLVTLDDLMTLDESSFKLLGRQIPMQALATAVSTSEALKKSVLGRLSGGLAEWLAQEVELQAAAAPAVVEERVRQVVGALTKLVREGRVVLRKAAPTPAAFEAVSRPPEPETAQEESARS